MGNRLLKLLADSKTRLSAEVLMSPVKAYPYAREARNAEPMRELSHYMQLESGGLLESAAVTNEEGGLGV